MNKDGMYGGMYTKWIKSCESQMEDEMVQLRILNEIDYWVELQPLYAKFHQTSIDEDLTNAAMNMGLWQYDCF